MIGEYGPRLEHAPADVVYVGRAQFQGRWKLTASPWFNPHYVDTPCPACSNTVHTRDEAVDLYRERLLASDELRARLPELRAKTLACWCGPDERCHADVILELLEQEGTSVTSEPAVTRRLSIPDVTGLSLVEAALAYAEAGWYVIPLNTSSPKTAKNPGSVVGKRWPHKSSRDPEQIRRWFRQPHRGIGLHVGRSGAVAFDVDDAPALPDVLREILTDAVPFQSSRSNDPTRGAYVFALPEGVMPGNSQGGLKGAWGDVRGYNGIIAVEPSHHQKADIGGRYAWLRTGTLPVLPGHAADLLSEGGERGSAASHAEVAEFLEEHTGSVRAAWLEAALRRIGEAEPGTRHTVTSGVTPQLAREAAAEAYPAQLAYDSGLSVFCAALNGEAGRDPEGEWDSLFAWGVGQLTDERVAEVRARLGAAPAAVAGKPVLLPESFWSARAVLQHIRQAAHSRLESADGVFYGVLARLASMVPHTLRVDTGIKEPLSLNLQVILLGPSGAGKSSASGPPRRLLPVPPHLDQRDDDLNPLYRDCLPLGSGEGIAEAFMGSRTRETGEVYKSGDKKGEPKTEKIRAQVRHNVLVYADEGEALAKLMERSGATIGETLRRAFTGETIGQQNGRAETTRLVERGTYAMGVLVGFQPDTVLPVVRDRAGTPQRFLFSSVRKDLPAVREDWPGELPDGPWTALFGQFGQEDPADAVITCTSLVRDEIYAFELNRRPEAEDPLDAHMPSVRAKVAALLALLDGRLEIAAEDWQLALVVWETSCAVRTTAVEYGRSLVAAETEARTALHVERTTRAEVAKVNAVVDDATERVARQIAEKVHTHSAPAARSDVRRKIAARLRPYFDDGLTLAEERGWVTVDTDGKIAPGGSRPS